MDSSEIENIVRRFSTYNDYLDSMLTKEDLTFLQDKDMCRELLSLGYHSNKRIIPKDVFEKKKTEIYKEVKEKKIREMRISSEGKVSDEVLMQALAKREEDNLMGRLTTIIFLRDLNSKGEEVSSYIDFAHRLAIEDWEEYFSGAKKLIPQPSDLSFYNWTKEESFYNSSPNFEAVTDSETLKLYFVCKKDGKAIEVNPKIQRKEEDEDPKRHDLSNTDYLQAVIFDHLTERPMP